MTDEEVAALAARQFNRFARRQVEARGCSDQYIAHRVRTGRWVAVEEAVFAIAPVLDDPWGRWMAATLTAPGTYLALWSAARAYEFLEYERPLITVMRHGNGGPRRHGGTLVYRRLDLAGEVGDLHRIPITSPERTLLDLAQYLTPALLGRALREGVRLRWTSVEVVAGFAIAHPRRRGTRKLLRVLAQYSDLPLERARSASEIRALMVLRDAGVELPELNRKVAGIEADLVWRTHRRIVEIDGEEFHLDRGQDIRRERTWRGAGYTVARIPATAVYSEPQRLLAVAPPPPTRSLSLSMASRAA